MDLREGAVLSGLLRYAIGPYQTVNSRRNQLMNKDIALKALEMAQTAGAQQARVTYTHSCLNQYTLLDGELEKLQHSLGSS